MFGIPGGAGGRLIASIDLQEDFPMNHRFAVALLVAVQLSCADTGTGPGDRRFNMDVQYGIRARNELNTFDDTFTKDLIVDGTATTSLRLSRADFDTIESSLQSVDIFSYPDTFIVQHSDTVSYITPFATYVLRVKLDSREKNLVWRDSIIISDIRASRLREVFDLIRKIVEATPEFRALPPPRGGYL